MRGIQAMLGAQTATLLQHYWILLLAVSLGGGLAAIWTSLLSQPLESPQLERNSTYSPCQATFPTWGNYAAVVGCLRVDRNKRD